MEAVVGQTNYLQVQKDSKKHIDLNESILDGTSDATFQSPSAPQKSKFAGESRDGIVTSSLFEIRFQYGKRWKL
mgnify:FL=1